MEGISVKIIDRLTENGTINPEDKELYIYGLHQGIIMLANILTTIAIGLVFGMVWQCVIFMAAYLPLRSFAGGFHARTQLFCYIYSIILTVAVLTAVKYIPWTNILCLITACISGTFILMLSPVEDKNKPLDAVEVRVYRKRVFRIFLAEAFLILVFLISDFLQIAVCVSVSLLALSIMLIIGKVKNSGAIQENS